METQNTLVLDACLTATHMPINALWPDARERVNIDKYACYITQQDYYNWSHFRDLNTYYKREPQDHLAERLTRFLVIALYNIGRVHSTYIRNQIDEWVMMPKSYDNILGMESLQGLALQSHTWKKIIMVLRRYMDSIHDGELHLAVEEEFIKGIEAWFRRARAAFYAGKKARMDILREDLIGAAYHPKRVEKWLEVGGFPLLSAMFGQDDSIEVI